MEKTTELLRTIVSNIVDSPDQVFIDATTDQMGVLITLKVDKTDIGKVIGREGNTAKAIRTILRVVGMKENARINLKIAEPEGGKYGQE